MALGLRWPSATCPRRAPSWQRLDGVLCLPKHRMRLSGWLIPFLPAVTAHRWLQPGTGGGGQVLSWGAGDVKMLRAHLGGQSWAWHGVLQVQWVLLAALQW